MKKLFNFAFAISGISLSIVIVGCGGGSQTQNYYSASANQNYQIVTESNSGGGSSQNLIVNTVNGQILNVPLTASGTNVYTFSTSQTSGTVILKNGNLGFIPVNVSNGLNLDFATINTNANQVPSGTYTTLCDQTELNPCVITINSNQITINEYESSSTPVNLCTNSTINAATNAINPNLFTFKCGVGGSNTNLYTWYLMPLSVNNVTGFMLNEWNPNSGANNNITNEIAFPQPSSSNAIMPNETYNYIYQASGYMSATVVTTGNNSLTNPAISACSSTSCPIVQGQFYNATFQLNGFDYFSTYTLVGNNIMGIFMDSFEGVYF